MIDIKHKNKKLNNSLFMMLMALMLVPAIANIKMLKNSTAEIKEAQDSVELASKLELETEPVDEIAESLKATTGYENFGLIKCSGFINLRSNLIISREDNIIASIPNGSACDILDEAENKIEGIKWYKVRINDLTGYVPQEFVLTGKNAEDNASMYEMTDAELLKDTDEYKTPSLDGEKIGIIQAGSFLKYTKINKDWYQIQYEDTISYIPSSVELKSEKTYFTGTIPAEKQESFLNEYKNFGITNNTNIINIYQEENMKSTVLGALSPHSAVDILETNGEWTNISSGNVNGYIESKYIIDGDEAKDYGRANAELMAFIGDEDQEIYSQPSRLAKIWTKVAKYQNFRVIGQDKYWIEIQLDEGDTEENKDRAFINIENENVKIKYSLNVATEFQKITTEIEPEESLVSANNMSLRNNIIEYGCQFIGNPYVWGGTDLVNGADCSGFCQSVLKHFGIHIPRVSRDQAKVGTPINSIAEAKPGDLVFYANSSGTINHVAMYIGNGTVVMAGSAATGIRLAAYNYRTPVAMRNVIGDRER